MHLNIMEKMIKNEEKNLLVLKIFKSNVQR